MAVGNNLDLMDPPTNGNGTLTKKQESNGKHQNGTDTTVEELKKELHNKNESLNQAVDSIVVIDNDKKVTFFNKAAERMFGYSREEVIGQNVKMLVPIEHRQNHDSYVENNQRTGNNKVVGTGRDLEMTRKDGSKFWGNLALSKVVTNDGINYTAFIKDITEDLNTKQVAAHIKSAVDTGWASIEFEPDGTIIVANENFINTLGYDSVNQITGKHHRIFCDPSYTKTSEYKHFWDELGRGEIKSGEFPRLKKDGSEVWINASYTPVKDDSGKVVKVIKIASDITAMIEMRNQANAIKSAVDTGWASIEFTPEGNILSANPNFIQALGYSHEKELVGNHHRMFCDPDYTKSPDYKQFWNDLAHGTIQSGEFKRITKNGKEIWINASYTPIKDENGEVYKVIKIATDISKVKIPVLQVSSILKGIAEGNLAQNVDIEADGYVKEMADAIGTAVGNLNELLQGILELANLVAASSEEMTTKGEEMKSSTGEMSSAIQQMAEGVQDQSQQVDEISKLLAAVLDSAKGVAEKANQINKSAEEGTRSSKAGTETIKSVVGSMQEIQKSAEVTSKSIGTLTNRSEEIARTLNVITDIASQTNLLALNAAIEAARAGDAGRGFAVVAEEIRKLAEDSRNSAQEIEKVINEVQKDIDLADKSIQGMEKSVNEGNKASKDAESVFETIDRTSSDTYKKSEEISKGAQSQEESINNTVKAVERIVVVSEETASGTEQVASSSKELRHGMDEVSSTSRDLADVANQLLKNVSKFTLKAKKYGKDNDDN
ncbi:MAG: PAS domain S-box protein [Bacteroidota bacterium]